MAKQKTRKKNKPTNMRSDNAARCWFELKNVHKRSSKYLFDTASLFSQYSHPVVLKKIAKNGDDVKFNNLQLQVRSELKPLTVKFSELWNRHKDKNRLCHNYTELAEAFALFEEYQKFDMQCFDTFHPIVTELNVIFNKALKELLENGEIQNDPNVNVVTDLEFKETPLPSVTDEEVSNLQEVNK